MIALAENIIREQFDETPTDLRPEIELLLCCTRPSIDDKTSRRMRFLLRDRLDWPFILRASLLHGLLPSLYWTLASICPEEVPQAVMEQLRTGFYANSYYNLYRTEKLISILRLFEKHHIRALPFKGPVLAVATYDNLALRQFSDLDVLVAKHDIVRAKNLLLLHGYCLEISQTWTQKVVPLLSQKKDYILGSEDGWVRVELHCRLSGWHFRFPLDLKRLWKELVPISVGGSTIKSLPPEESLLYLCMHGSRHGWERLMWIRDIAQLINVNQNIDWTGLREKSRSLGSERMLALGLSLANTLLETPIPREVSDWLEKDDEVKYLTSQMRDRLLHQTDSAMDIAYWHNFHLRVRERSKDRTWLHLYYISRYFHIAITPNEKDRALLPLPPFASFLYYLLRPIRLMKEYILFPPKKRRS